MRNKLSYSRAVIDALADVSDKVDVDMSAKVLRSDLPIALLAGGVFALGFSTLIGACEGRCSSDDVVPADALDMRAGVRIGMLVGKIIGVAPGVGVNVPAGEDSTT